MDGNKTYALAMWAVLACAVVGCNSANNRANDSTGGEVKVDGSSTVYPITEAVAEEFSLQHRGVRGTVGASGTGGGMKKFAQG